MDVGMTINVSWLHIQRRSLLPLCSPPSSLFKTLCHFFKVLLSTLPSFSSIVRPKTPESLWSPLWKLTLRKPWRIPKSFLEWRHFRTTLESVNLLLEMLIDQLQNLKGLKKKCRRLTEFCCKMPSMSRSILMFLTRFKFRPTEFSRQLFLLVDVMGGRAEVEDRQTPSSHPLVLLARVWLKLLQMLLSWRKVFIWTAH